MTIQVWTAKIPRQRTVRAAKTRTSASGCRAGGGSRSALERSAVCQSTERSPHRYFSVEIVRGAISKNSRMNKDFLTAEELGPTGLYSAVMAGFLYRAPGVFAIG